MRKFFRSNHLLELCIRIYNCIVNIFHYEHTLHGLSEDERFKFKDHIDTVTRNRTKDVVLKLMKILGPTETQAFPEMPRKFRITLVYNYLLFSYNHYLLVLNFVVRHLTSMNSANI